MQRDRQMRPFTARGLLTLIFVSGCGGGSSSGPADDPDIDTSGLLVPVQSAAELETSIKSGLTAPPAATPPALDAGLRGGVDAPEASSGFTTTYTQERNVDEFDVVKYDGEFMYIAPIRMYGGCCWILEAADTLVAQPPDREPQNTIRILQTDPPTGGATPVGSITLEDEDSVQGLYLDSGRMTALTTKAFYGHYGDPWASIALWADQSTGVHIYDVSDPTNPVLGWHAELDGGFVASRRIGNIVYLIARHTPSIAGLIYEPTTAADRSTNESLLDGTPIADLLPNVRVNGVARELVNPTSCYVTNDPARAGYPVLTTITAIPLDNPDALTSLCYNEDAYGVYVSENAIYLSQYRYDTSGDASLTRLHKFAFAAGGISYRGSGEVAGYLWSGGHADFRASEHDGYLRVVTTEYTADAADNVDHRLFVLAESTIKRALDVVAQLPNPGQPEEIGKPNEDLYGVRFFGNRAYAVTFRRIDPLYVIDLIDPTQPRLAGELEVTGFSDFLHPVTDELLLGLGQTEQSGIKIELFDITDLDNPRSLGSETLGGRGSRSEAQWDRHAFTYLAVSEETDRFTVPADLYALDGSNRWRESGLYLFEVRNKDVASLANLAAVGSLVVQTPTATNLWPSGFRNRSIIHDDTVYYIRDEAVWSTFWVDVGIANGPF